MIVYGYSTTLKCEEYIHMNLGHFGLYHDMAIVNKEMSHSSG